MNNTQIELQNRIKLLMEYDTKHTLTENLNLLSEQILGWLGKNVADDIISSLGKKQALKTAAGTTIKNSDELLNVLKTSGLGAIDDVSKELVRNSILKNNTINLTNKNQLINDLVGNRVTQQNYLNNSNLEIFDKWKSAGYPEDVAQTIANKLKPKGGKQIPKGATSPSSKTNVSNNIDDVFVINQKKLRSDLELIFPKAKRSDITKLVTNIKTGLPKSQKEFDALFTQAINHHAPNYKSMLQNQTNRVTYWEKFQTLSWKLKAALLALASYPTCNYIVPVFGTDCTTLISDIINNLTQGAYDTAKKIKRPNTGATPAPAQTTGNNSIIQDAETFLKNNNYWAQGMELTPTNNPDEVSWKMATGETGTIKKQQDGTFK
jgi:hypothetical protein